MEGTSGTEQKAKVLWQSILDSAIKVISNPAEFFRNMAKSGGFVDPLIFMVVMGVIGGVVRAILGVIHLGMAGSTAAALASVILVPVFALIFGFVGAAILFVIWKLMGSNESYETAYRCGAYASAISPITAVLGVIPFAGALIGLVWMLYLLVTASVEVHKIAAKTAWMVFGIIAAILALTSTCSQIAARRMQRQAGAWEKEFGKSFKETTPEEASQAAAAMAKAMQEEMAKARKAAEENR
jgi:hypothetical protein